MAQAVLDINLDAIVQNWTALNQLSDQGVETAAVIKADAYGLDASVVGPHLEKSGVKSFFVATTEEGVDLRQAIGNSARIFIFSGAMAGDEPLLKANNLIPLLNSPDQFARCNGLPFGIQLDSGMNRLGMEADEFKVVKDAAQNAELIMSHLACADEPDHAYNQMQLKNFCEMTADVDAPRSLSATGGILLGPEYHFDLCRPGIGLYGGAPFSEAHPVVKLSLPIIQTRRVQKGEGVGYGASWIAQRDSIVATLASGYADGIIRSMGFGKISLYAGDTPCPLIGRVSMDLLTVDVTDLDDVPSHLDLLNAHQGVDDLADAAGTIGYEFLTSLGQRYARHTSKG